jgi:hypothetical protein
VKPVKKNRLATSAHGHKVVIPTRQRGKTVPRRPFKTYAELYVAKGFRISVGVI